jgi:hypothetical protein
MITNRILQIIEYKGISKRQFYIKTNLSNGFLDKVKDIGVSKVENILNAFPEVNPIWLLTGQGEMLLSPNGSSRNSTCADVEYLKKEIKYLNEKLKDKEEIIRLMQNQK